MQFVPFRAGVEICPLHEGIPQVALLKYHPGASVPLHRHEGLETIMVLDGSQTDEKGTITAGDVALNLPGTQHSVRSRDGCVVLIQWTKPVTFL